MFRRDEYINDDVDLHAGIVLTIGFVPGLKVDVIPILRTAMVTNSLCDADYGSFLWMKSPLPIFHLNAYLE